MQKLTYRTIKGYTECEIPKIRGSRFLTYLFPCEDKVEAEECLNKIRKDHFSATHHCSARRVGLNIHEDLFGNVIIDSKTNKANDDGEPTNTAGKPILTVLEGEKLFNIEAIVVRYFGGTLLGVGGLIQAYTNAVKESIKQSEIIEKEILKKINLRHEYSQTAIIAHLIEKYDIDLISEVCDEKATKQLSINQGYLKDFQKELFEASNGTLSIEL